MGTFDDFKSRLVNIGRDIMSATLDAVTNVITMQLGDAVSGQQETTSAELWQHVGFTSIPSPCSAGQNGCQAVTLNCSDHDVIIATRDTRAAKVVGNLKPGETALWGTGKDGNAQGKILIKQDGSVSIFTTDSNTQSGNAVTFQVSPLGLYFSAPWGTFKLDSTGFHVTTNTGGRMDLGGIGGMPGPLAALTSYFIVHAGLIKIDGPQVLLGPSLGTPPYQPAAYGLSVNPLTQPLIPILGLPMGIPIGLLVSNSVRISG